ncbi:hypothetical protein BD413DRAFT_571518 [Trametes elegans]|nr:hypothetical protein BD413DRAFT_571518 [Trametes elegans]
MRIRDLRFVRCVTDSTLDRKARPPADSTESTRSLGSPAPLPPMPLPLLECGGVVRLSPTLIPPAAAPPSIQAPPPRSPPSLLRYTSERQRVAVEVSNSTAWYGQAALCSPFFSPALERGSQRSSVRPLPPLRWQHPTHPLRSEGILAPLKRCAISPLHPARRPHALVSSSRHMSRTRRHEKKHTRTLAPAQAPRHFIAGPSARCGRIAARRRPAGHRPTPACDGARPRGARREYGLALVAMAKRTSMARPASLQRTQFRHRGSCPLSVHRRRVTHPQAALDAPSPIHLRSQRSVR